ncbi:MULTISPECIES: NAD-dependent epimerase/dehydratase family protein [unclassified Pseudomonas]|uniref:NAD-dependent epimerase/dehydratase family protein n=1 Tax=unclassified Pseudomonas TaxID=196821 RepID=UPI00244CAFC3|nr:MULTISPECIES: NAD-dependent epimerase/dehydratase family protein [unclassified Pseudomonas]MDG9925357.1 NAD-dependent epimerase/dehydratase family protein [Pseudomonas sp. GD04045]MDH0037303.1 NAD-dependent epimerase/dehydratase family protein [Pseudomonas sp. GD04019]
MMRVLVTGASGFVGGALVRRLITEPEIQAVAGVREPTRAPGDMACDFLELGNLEDCRLEAQQLQGVQVVVHTAARVHVMRERSADPLAEFQRVNVDGTLSLARAAAAAGVRRFLFVSSIKVNGESTPANSPFRADDLPAPMDSYGISKLEAEQGLFQIARESGMEVVIIRPPLVYGPGVRANFLSMMRWLHRGIPLPLGGIDNRRSLVALDNLVDLLVRCLAHPAAVNQVFLVSDGEDLSTSELLRRLGLALKQSARLWSWATPMLHTLLRITGRDALIQRLYGSLQVDIDKTRTLLDWAPPISSDEALRLTAESFRRNAC